MSMIDLPSDAETEVDIISLPDDVDSEEAATEPSTKSTACNVEASSVKELPIVGCCQKHCIESVDKEALWKFRDMLNKLGKDAQDEYICDALRGLTMQMGPSERRIHWMFLGQRVCRRGFGEILGIGQSRLVRLMDHVREGHLGAPTDLRTIPMPSEQESWQRRHAHDYFMKFWHDPARSETLAEDVIMNIDALDVILPNLTAAEFKKGKLLPVAPNGFREWLLSPGAVAAANTESTEEVRYRSPTTMGEWYDDYVEETPAESMHAGMSTWLRVYNESWASILKVRRIGVHSTCMTCDRWRMYRKHAHSLADFNVVKSGQEAHINVVRMNRAISERLESLGEAATAPGAIVSTEASILDMTGDGADQAKFKLPRQTLMQKIFDTAWRPQMHVIGNMASGLLEAFYITDLDIPKDANLACTCLARSLERCTELLQERGTEMPDHVRYHIDNASEGKNLILFAFLSFLVWKDAFISADATMYEVGHTHNKQDQTIGTVCTGIARNSKIEDPEELVGCVKGAMHPTHGRVGHVEYIQATLDFKTWLSSLDVTLTGQGSHASWKSLNLESCHVWRFLKRKHLTTFAQEQAQTTFTEPLHPDDIVLLVKHHLSSDGYAQPPQCLIPNSRFELLEGVPGPAPRNVFSQIQTKEFLKTAHLVKQVPWKLDKAASYLERLVHGNADDDHHHEQPMPHVTWVFAPRRLKMPTAGLLSDASLSTPLTPVWVTTGPASQRAVKPAEARTHPTAAKTLAKARVKRPAAAPLPHEMPEEDGRERAPPLAGAPGGAEEPGAPLGSGVARRPPAKKRITSLSQLPDLPPGRTLGCSKCNHSVCGCRRCRGLIGLQESEPGVWKFLW